MAIYLINLISIPMWYLFLRSFIKPKDKLDNTVISIVCVQMILIMGLRGLDVGVDTRTYKMIFDSLSHTSWLYVPSFYIELLYSVMNKTVSFIGLPFNAILLINAAISLGGIRYLIVKYSKNKILSLYMFICIGYMSSMMNIMRQYVALTFIILAYMAVMEKKHPAKALFFFLVAFLIHDSSVILFAFLILYWILNLQKVKETLVLKILVFLGSFVLVFMLGKIITVLGLDYDHLASAAAYEYSIFNFNFLLKIFSIAVYFFIDRYYVHKGEIYKKDLSDMHFLNYLMIVSCFMNLASVEFNMFTRFNLYFSIMLIVFIPNLLAMVPYREKSAVKVVMYAGLTLLFMMEMMTNGNKIIPYAFMSLA